MHNVQVSFLLTASGFRHGKQSTPAFDCGDMMKPHESSCRDCERLEILIQEWTQGWKRSITQRRVA